MRRSSGSLSNRTTSTGCGKGAVSWSTRSPRFRARSSAITLADSATTTWCAWDAPTCSSLAWRATSAYLSYWDQSSGLSDVSAVRSRWPGVAPACAVRRDCPRRGQVGQLRRDVLGETAARPAVARLPSSGRSPRPRLRGILAWKGQDAFERRSRHLRTSGEPLASESVSRITGRRLMPKSHLRTRLARPLTSWGRVRITGTSQQDPSADTVSHGARHYYDDDYRLLERLARSSGTCGAHCGGWNMVPRTRDSFQGGLPHRYLSIGRSRAVLLASRLRRECHPASAAPFQSITIALSGEDIRATFRMRWRRSWWRFGRGPESEVTLLVEGTDAADVELLRQALHPAVCRGTGIGITVAQGAIGLLLMMLNAVAFALITILTIVSVAYVLKFDPVRSTNLVVAGLACGFILGAWAASWAFPSLEVADHRQSHVWRLVKAATPVVLPILLAGLTKLVYR